MPIAQPLFALHDARALAGVVGVAHPCCSSIALPYPLGGQGARAPLASFVDGNPLSADWLLDVEIPGDRIILWSGTLAEDLFADEPRTWMCEGHDAFRAFCDAAAPTLVARERRVAFRPHARHVLSDVPGCVTFLRTREGQPFDLALSPADLLTPDMVPNIEDHLVRSIETLGPLAAMILLHDVAPPAPGSEAPLRAVPLGEGCLPRDRVLRLLAAHVPPSTPVVLLPAAMDRQAAWLNGS